MKDLEELVQLQRRDPAGPDPRRSLGILRSMLRDRGEEIAEAIRHDLGRCWLESWSAEPGLALAETQYALKHLRRWRRACRCRLSPPMIPGRVRSRREPYGIAVIIGPWNYPAGLLLSPMVSALAAGNSVILKPSERAPATAEVMFKLIEEYFPKETAAVAGGSGDVARWLVANAADVVCFTGSGRTGKNVMADAAKRPVPAILELGGVNPCFVSRDADLRASARRIAWGKYLGAGQTCLAPNHVFVHRSVFGDFVSELGSAVKEFYGENPMESPDYGRIIDGAAWDRLEGMLHHGRAATGGTGSREELYIPPTVLVDIDDGSPLLHEEIFGPILPVVPFDSLEETVAGTGKGDDSPLAVYGFSADKRGMEEMLVRNTRSGSVTVNGTLHRIVSSSIGFGGVGGSGFGRYRGIEGYRAFSWERIVLRKNGRFEMPLLYPPYRIHRRFVKFMLKHI
ncbi:MAG: aldehyde dehydrogenase family protein [Candidatus Fermentibacteraceae bacterium]|nr:aldehyde dehydrogenase family protein [Candidatus Fermentibacteraceae bacterium]